MLANSQGFDALFPAPYLSHRDRDLFFGDNPAMRVRRPLRALERQNPAGRVSLDRALSKLGLASRAEARRLIAAGRISVNGRIVTHPATMVVPERVRISIDGAEPRQGRRAPRTLILNKPRGSVTTRRDPDGRRTVFDVLGDAGRGLFAVGRLDFASTGLLIFTNDTQLANRLTDPSNQIPRRYVVTVRGRVTPETVKRLAVSHADIRKASGRETHLIVELRQGKNRELRRLFNGVGHEPTRIHRISFGEYELGSLQPGERREV